MRALFLAILFVPSLAAAQGHSVADPQTGCKIAFTGPTSSDFTISWSGPCARGFAHGRGILLHFVGGTQTGRYEGDMQYGWATGRGVWTSDSWNYTGQWLKGIRHGQGVQTWPSGGRYQGRYQNGLPQGFGTYRAADGRTFSGQWSNGCFKQGNSQVAVGTTNEKCGFQ